MSTTEPTTEQPTEQFDFGKKKKKKTTTTKATKAAPAEDSTTPTTGKPTEAAAQSKGEEEPAGEINLGEEESAKPEDNAPAVKREFKELTAVEGKDYTYEQLAGRIYSLMNASRPEEKTVYKMKPPVVYREGTKKTVWVNFPEICRIMNRQPEHVLSFVLAEVGSTGSIDGSQRLVIKGRFQPKHIENILRHYISEYVKCHTCKSPETHLKKENRLVFMVCDKCGSSRSVAPIKTGFQAATRASRKAEKEKKG